MPTLSVLLLTSVCLGDVAGAATTTWSTIQGSIAATICFPTRDGVAAPTAVYGFRSHCGTPGSDAAVDTVVDDEFKASLGVIAPISGYESAVSDALKAIPADADATKRLELSRAAYLNDPAFIRPLARRVIAELGRRNITCTDCPTFPSAPKRDVPWVDIVPYVLAFVSVDPIVSVNPDGSKRPFPHLAVHFCTGINTVGELPHNPAFARIGYATATTDEFKQVVGDELIDLIATPDYERLRTDAQRTTYARTQLPVRLASKPEMRAAVCKTAASVVDDVGVAVVDCK